MYVPGNTLKSRVLLPLLAGVIGLTVACSSGAAPAVGSPTPMPELSVVTTIYPVTYFAERIGGERVLITSLAQPGVEAHDFEPTPGDIRTISQADVLVYTSPAFEVWVDDAVKSAGSNSLIVVKTANVRGDFPVNEQGEIDPHIWLNPLRATEQVRAIQAAFVEADPEGEPEYALNADVLVNFLLLLDQEFSAGLRECALRTIVVSHEAYGHLAERYQLEQIGLADLSAEFESTPRRISEIVDRMRELGISYILQEPILNNELAETVAAETGASILPLHPLESLTPAQVEAGDTYFTVMSRNLESLRTALRCE